MLEVTDIIEDGDDSIQRKGGSPPPPRITYASTPPRNTAYASNNSVHSSSSPTTLSTKKRKTRPVTDGRLLNQSDWQIKDGMRDFNHSRASKMSSTSMISDALSPRSNDSPTQPSLQHSQSNPARSYILIDSSSPEYPDTPMTASFASEAATGNTPKSQQQVSQDILCHLGRETSPLANRSTDLHQDSRSIALPFRAGSNASSNYKSSCASSALSDPPESRGQSFDTFQAELWNQRSRSPPNFGSLSLNEPPAKAFMTDKGGQLLIDLSADSSDDSDSDVEIVPFSASPKRQARPEHSMPANWCSSTGKPFAFIRGQKARFDVEEMAEQRRIVSESSSVRCTSQSSTPPKRKREEAFPDDIDSNNLSENDPAGNFPPHSPDSSRCTNKESNASSPKSKSRSPGSRSISSQPIQTIEILDDEPEAFVEEEDFVDLSDDENLSKNPIGVLGRANSPIEIEDSVPAVRPHHHVYDADGVDYEDSDDDDDEVEFVRTVRRSLSVAQGLSLSTVTCRRKSTIIEYRNPAIVYPLEDIGEVVHRGWSIKQGTFMEVSDLDGTDTTFLRVNHVIHHQITGEIKLRGHQFMRTKFLSGTLYKKYNEMCRILEVDEDDPRPWLDQAQIEVDLDACIYAPRPINITNRPFGTNGTCTFRPVPKGTDFQMVQDRMMLACRWECIVFWPSARNRLQKVCKGVPSKRFQMLQEGDPHLMGKNVQQSAADIRDEWRGRGVTIPGGGYIPDGEFRPQGFFKFDKRTETIYKASFNLKNGRESFNVINSTFNIDLTSDGPISRPPSRSPSTLEYQEPSAQKNECINRSMTDLTEIPRNGSIRASLSSNARSRLFQVNSLFQTPGQPIKRLPGQKYTYGDAFCGAGGATRGAYMAGLKVIWGFDKDTHACSSWHKNFPSAAIYEMTAHEVCSQPSVSLVCDILHMSPPCQFFSPAHTIAGRDDEMNTASLLACHEILRCARPRIVTLEQTFGITHAQFALYFNAVVNMFTTNGYSITYKICQLHHWGLAQRRTRLIIIGSGPGERLPQIPAYTHSKDGDPSNGILRFTGVRSLIKDIKPGDPDHNLHNVALKQRRLPWDGDGICPRAMTTAGGQNFHFDGVRGFTNREFAAIQGFPLEHVFALKGVKKQIGNAVPPTIAKILFQAVARSLEESDRVEKEVITLDD